MKIISMIAAAMIGGAAMLAPVAATAQREVTTKRVVVTHRTQNVRHSNGNRWGRHYRNRRVCKVTYRNDRRIRRCRTIRVRY